MLLSLQKYVCTTLSHTYTRVYGDILNIYLIKHIHTYINIHVFKYTHTHTYIYVETNITVYTYT